MTVTCIHEDIEKLEPIIIAAAHAKWYSCFETDNKGSYKNLDVSLHGNTIHNGQNSQNLSIYKWINKMWYIYIQ